MRWKVVLGAIATVASVGADAAQAASLWQGAPVQALAADGGQVVLATAPVGTRCGTVVGVDLRRGTTLRRVRTPFICGHDRTIRLAAADARTVIDVTYPVVDHDDGTGAQVRDDGRRYLATSPTRRAVVVARSQWWDYADSGGGGATSLTGLAGGGGLLVAGTYARSDDDLCDPPDERICTYETWHLVTQRADGRVVADDDSPAVALATNGGTVLTDSGLLDPDLGVRATLPTLPRTYDGDVAADTAVRLAPRRLEVLDATTGTLRTTYAVASDVRHVRLGHGLALIWTKRSLTALRLADGRRASIVQARGERLVAADAWSSGIVVALNRGTTHGRLQVVGWRRIDALLAAA